MGYEASSLWLATLAEHPDDSESEHRSALRNAFIQFRSHVTPIAQEIALSAPAYTDHSILHCDSLWDTASLLIDDSLDLNPAEAFVLGGAFLVHDLGMGLSAYPGGLEGILNDISWKDLLASLFDNAESLQEQALTDLEANPNWDGQTDQQVKGALVMFMRSQHAKQAERVLQEEWKLSSGESLYLLPDTALRHWYGNAIGKIARSHWIDVAQLPEYLPPTLGAIPGYPTDWKVDPIKVACALRLSDVVHIDGRRADPLHTPHRNPQGEAANHWHFQEKFLSLQVEENRAIFSSSSPFDTTQIDAWWLAYDMVRQADSELRRVDSLCADLGLPRFTANAAAGAESPKRFSKFVETLDWEPVDARPYIGDQNLVMRRLGGTALYGATREDTVPLRESLANALDATRALRLAYPENTPDAIEIAFSTSDGVDSISIRDYGIGMTSSDVRDKLCNFGTSGWRDSSTQAAFPGLLGAGFSPTGRFGIGFFSVFMAASTVRVTTRHVSAGLDGTLVLEFVDGLDGRPVLRAATREEQLLKPGTRLELHLDHPLDSADGLYSTFYREELESDEIMASLIARLALMSDEDIVVKAMGRPAFVPAVSRDQWRECDPYELFDMINSPTVRNYPHYESQRQNFGRMLRPIHSPTGTLVGRLGLSVSSTQEYYDHWVHNHRGYCGGLLANLQVVGIVGVASGEPTAATRRDINLELALPELVRWFDEQLTLLPDVIEPRAALRVQEFAVSIGATAVTLPLSFSVDGYRSPAETQSKIEDADSFVVVEASPLVLEISGVSHNLFELDFAEDFGIVDESMLVIPDGSSYFDRGLATRPNEFEGGFSDQAQSRAALNLEFWWKNTYRSVLAEVLRLASAAWDVSLEDLIIAIEPLDVWRNGLDTRLEIRTLGGAGKVDGYRIHNPKKLPLDPVD